MLLLSPSAPIITLRALNFAICSSPRNPLSPTSAAEASHSIIPLRIRIISTASHPIAPRPPRQPLTIIIRIIIIVRSIKIKLPNRNPVTAIRITEGRKDAVVVVTVQAVRLRVETLAGVVDGDGAGGAGAGAGTLVGEGADVDLAGVALGAGDAEEEGREGEEELDL